MYCDIYSPSKRQNRLGGAKLSLLDSDAGFGRFALWQAYELRGTPSYCTTWHQSVLLHHENSPEQQDWFDCWFPHPQMLHFAGMSYSFCSSIGNELSAMSNRLVLQSNSTNHRETMCDVGGVKFQAKHVKELKGLKTG